MSRFLLRNTVRDPRFAVLRKRNESLVVLRPFIGGKPLPPAATRILVRSDLNPTIISEIEALVAIGNVEFLAVGRQGPAIDFKALRLELGQAPVAPTAEAVVATEVVTEVVATPVPAKPEPVSSVEEAPLAAPEPAPEAVIEEPAATAATSTEEAPAEKVWTREELEAAKLVDLRDILIALGGKPAGKNKATVVDEILAAQGGV